MNGAVIVLETKRPEAVLVTPFGPNHPNLAKEARMAGIYVRTTAHRAAIAESNARLKRKYPKEHGLRSRLYNIWRAMTFRCYYPSHEAYERYGGRGITICDEWRNDFLAFRAWALAGGYVDTLTIDRIDNGGGYNPRNCRWVSIAAQQSNRKDSLAPITAFGETKTIKEWSNDPRCVVGYQRLWARLKAGTSIEVAITAIKVIPQEK